jgi:CMP-N-acetylneuraminic acid synthetase
MNEKIVALVPMRHHSERIPGKNYRSFSGRPLFHYIVENLIRCPYIDEIVIDTDSPIIKEDAAVNFPSVMLLDRPEHLRHPSIPMNDVLLHDVIQIDADFYLQTHSTNPLLRSNTITHAIEAFLKNYPSFDSLFSVTKIQTRLWDGLTRPINHNPAILLRTQDLPPIFEENSCMYIFSRDTLEKRHNRIGERPLMFEIDTIEAWDIDEESDYTIAEVLYKEREKIL